MASKDAESQHEQGPFLNDPSETKTDPGQLESEDSSGPEVQPKCPHPTKRVQYESKIVVEEEGRMSTQNIQISSTYTPSTEANRVGDANKSGNVVMETWISSEDNALSDIDTTTFLHLNLLTELARSKCICRKRQNESIKEEDAGPSEGVENTKPMKKARYSWQVKNLPERNQENQAQEKLVETEDGKENLNLESGLEAQKLEAVHKRSITPVEPDETESPPPKFKCQNISILGAMKKTYDDRFKISASNDSESGVCESTKSLSSGEHSSNSSKTNSENNQDLDFPSCVESAVCHNLKTPTSPVQLQNSGDSGAKHPRSVSEETSVASSSETPATHLSASQSTESSKRHTPSPLSQAAEASVSLQILRNRNRERPSRSYLQKLQHQHIAKSIVDNALNTSLEVLGFSPDNSRRNLASQRRRVEDDAVSAAIQSRGLQNHEPATSDPTSPIHHNQLVTQDRDIDPIINQLTEFSENIFARNLQRSNRTRPVTSGLDSDSSEEDELTAGTAVTESASSGISIDIIPGNRKTQNSQILVNTNHTVAHTSLADSNTENIDEPNPGPTVNPTTSDTKTHMNAVEKTGKEPECKSENVFDFGNYFEDSSALQSDILDKAVAAAINQKGLGLEHL